LDTGLYSRTYSSQGLTAGGNAAGLRGAASVRENGIGLVLGMLALAFMAGGLVVLMLMPRPTPPPVTPPAAVSAPVAPVQPIPAKRRRAHKPEPACAPLRQDSAAQQAQPQQAP